MERPLQVVPIESMIKQGYLYILEGDYFSAMFTFNDVLKIDRMNITARLWLAYTYTKLGNYNAAIQEYQNVLIVDPYNLNAQKPLQILKAKSGLKK